MQELETARGAVCENDHATLAKLLVSCKDGVVEDYIKFHKNELHVVCNSEMWLQFEKEILELENLEVEMSEFHIAFAKQCIEYIADACDNDELAWRLWLCLWVVGFIDIHHIISCLAFIMEKMDVCCQLEVSSTRKWIVMLEFVQTNSFVDCVPIVVRSQNDTHTFRMYGAWTMTGSTKNQPLNDSAHKTPVKVTQLLQSLQQCFVRPPDRVIQLLDLPRFQTPIGTEV